MKAAKITRDRKGQFLILTTLGIVVMMIALATISAYTSVAPMSFAKYDFKEKVMELDLNFRRALAISIADISKELQFKASTTVYANYTKLDDYPEALASGREFLSKWLNTTLVNYAGLGISVNISYPIFFADWSTSSGYSRASANMTLDILSYGFSGWEAYETVELNSTLLGLKDTNGNETWVYFNIKRESGEPVLDLTPSMVTVLYQKTTGTFKTASVVDLRYYGEGTYLVKFNSDMPSIVDSLDLLKELVMELGQSAYIPPNSPEALCLKIDAVISQYYAKNLWGMFQKLSEDVRPHLDNDPGTEQSWIYPGIDTSECLALIDKILALLFPKIKVYITDPRGIIVGNYAWLYELSEEYVEDVIGPETRYLVANPDPIGKILPLLDVSAYVRDYRSTVAEAELFVDTIETSGTGIPLLAVDGTYNEPGENVRIQLNVTSWSLGNHTLYVHGKDSNGNWGGFKSVVVEVLDSLPMHVESIDLTFVYPRPSQRKIVASVTVVDILGNPVRNAWVEAHWSGEIGFSEAGYTDSNGIWRTGSRNAKRSGTYTFTVDDINLFGWHYDESANVETSDSLTG